MKAKDLKNSILQMAVQGKLVPQDPNDEPASVLLKRIREERAQLIKEKKIKKPKGGESVIHRASDGSHYEKRGDGEPVCIDDEIPFEIPDSWEWCRFESVITIATNLVGPDKFGDFAHIAPDNIEKSSGRLLSFNSVSEDRVKSKNHLFRKGQILYSKIRPALRKVTIAPVDGLCSADMYPLETQMDKQYVLNFLLSDYFTEETLKSDTRVKMPKTNQASLAVILVPIPPLAEQKRIGDTLTKLSEPIVQYGVLEDARELLDTELPDRLRKSVLQMAVQGKLVPQDPADEPASVLLERIRDERRRLVDAGKAKAPKGGESVIYRASDGGYYEKHGNDEPVCIDDEIPFEIPDSWEWTRLGSIANYINGFAFKPEHRSENGIPIIRIQNLTDPSAPYNTTNIDVDECYGLVDGDVLVSWSATLKAFIWNRGRAYLNQHIFKVQFYENLDRDYYKEVLNFVLPFMKEATHGSTMHHLTRGVFESILFPMPPIAEQHRIADAISQLDTTIFTN
jgi:type I restriction enzyme S subunit